MQLRDDLLSLLVAGHETTGSVLTWTLYLLSKVYFYFLPLFGFLENIISILIKLCELTVKPLPNFT